MFKHVVVVFLCLLLSVNCLAQAQDQDSDLKIKLAMDLDAIKTSTRLMHEKFYSLFDTLIEKSELKHAPEALRADFRRDYEQAVDKHVGQKDIAYTLAFYLSQYLSVEQLENNAKFYKTDLGVRVQENIENRRLATDGFSKEEITALFELYKEYQILDVVKVLPEAIQLWRENMLQKVNRLGLEFQALEAGYLVKYIEASAVE